MEAVKISPKFQVVIPKRLRNALKLLPGQKIQMVAYDNRIEMIPLRKISEMKGFLAVDSKAKADQIQTIDKSRLVKFTGDLTPSGNGGNRASSEASP